MLFEFVDTLQRNRRLIYIAAFIVIDFWLLAIGSHILQAHRSSITAQIHASETAVQQPVYQNDIFSGGVISDNVSHIGYVLEVGLLRTTIAATDTITAANHDLWVGLMDIARGIVMAIIMVIRVIAFIFLTIIKVTGAILLGIGRIIAFPFVAIAHGTGYVVRNATKLAHVQPASIIEPEKVATNAPVITPRQAQQALLIQQNTIAVILAKQAGYGGACDSGNGNGGYPLRWCDARMDSVSTVWYTGDHINRECTSYAYWYFTTVEGHTDFHVTDNANRWAYTSNYPTHKMPAVGAIAVEDSGYYGHVAIVQALPGQTFDGKVVPTGDILVSEMNYDWQGHFRFSYSPLDKFSAFIYK